MEETEHFVFVIMLSEIELSASEVYPTSGNLQKSQEEVELAGVRRKTTSGSLPSGCASD